MASKKFKELQEYSLEDLRVELETTETSYQKMRFDHAIKGLEDPMRLREVRRDIARILTEIRRRELLDAPAEILAGRSRLRTRRRKEA
jgi:large subunit ribosomal protein L29